MPPISSPFTQSDWGRLHGTALVLDKRDTSQNEEEKKVRPINEQEEVTEKIWRRRSDITTNEG